LAKPREPPAGKGTFTVAVVEGNVPVRVKGNDWSAPVSLNMVSIPAVLSGMRLPVITTETDELVLTEVSGKVNGFALMGTPFTLDTVRLGVPPVGNARP
jgi:hypothetical protein